MTEAEFIAKLDQYDAEHPLPHDCEDCRQEHNRLRAEALATFRQGDPAIDRGAD
jgi:hypothetical protein